MRPQRVLWEERLVFMGCGPGWLCAVCILSVDLGLASTGQLMTETPDPKVQSGHPCCPDPTHLQALCMSVAQALAQTVDR